MPKGQHNDSREQLVYQLTHQQKEFVYHYLQGETPMNAAIKAGYSENVARNPRNNIMAKQKVKDYLDYQLAKQQERTLITSDQILEDLYDVAEKCMGRKPVPKVLQMRDGTPFEYEGHDFDPAGANRALRSIGEHYKMFSDRVEHSHEHVSINLDLSGNQKQEKQVGEGSVVEGESREAPDDGGQEGESSPSES